MKNQWRRAWMELAYHNRGALRPAAGLLAPLSDLYGAVARRKRKNKRAARPCLVPVISIGNITVGGCGKTPLAQSIARLLQQQGRRPGVLLRGYQRKSNQALMITPSTFDPLRIPDYGDEAALYAFRCGLPTGVAAQRADAAQLLLDNTDCDVFILDDGFQHYQFHRDIDLVVVNGDNPFGNRHCLPLGPMREPASALREADAIIVRGGEIEFPNLDEMPIFKGGMEWTAVSPYAQWRQGDFENTTPIASLKPRRAALVSGLGDPGRFEQQARQLGVDVAAHYPFADHHWFTANEIAGVAANHETIITTEKDAVRLLALNTQIEDYADRLFVIQAEWRMNDQPLFTDWLQTRLDRASS